ncbi:acyltransferase [bacterium]|nr:MAG: acyltransferase [bacterium]
MVNKRSYVYFPGLNSIRFILALVIIVYHIEEIKIFAGIKNLFKISTMRTTAEISATFFFVLTGFLITYLLLRENKEFGNVSIKRFYARRVLRTWPLYFFLVILSLFILPRISLMEIPGFTNAIYDKFLTKATLYFLILPQVVSILFVPNPYCSHSWTIGIEEQIYLIWPLVLKNKRKYINIFVFFIIFFTGVIFVLNFILHKFKPIFVPDVYIKYLEFLHRYLEWFRIRPVAIGGLGGYLLFSDNKKVLGFIFKRNVQVVVFIILFLLLSNGVTMGYITYEFYSVLFCILLLNISVNKDSVIKLENKLLNYFGKVSYGLYMYHPIAIYISLSALKHLSINKDSMIVTNLFIYTVSLFLTVIFSLLSYFLFERWFLKFKVNFSRIVSAAK